MPEQILVSSVGIRVKTDCDLIAAAQVTKRLIEVELRAVEIAAQDRTDRQRPPLNLALVIDRSGSMGGAKLGYVKDAALHLIEGLSDTDQVAIVAYDNNVDTLLAPGPLTPERRALARQKVSALRPGGSTALFDGWLTGAELVASHPVPNAVTRVFLLTDGLANIGESRVEVLERHAHELFVRGVATSTFGVGADFNQFLLEGIAARGGGRYHFIESPGQAPAMFEAELGDLLSTSARRVEMRLTVPSGATLSLLGNLPHTVDGDILCIPVGEMYAGRPRTFFVEALLPPGTDDVAIPITVSGEAAGLQGDDESLAPFRVSACATFTWADAEAVRTAPIRNEVHAAAAWVRVATAETEALRLEYGGEGERGAQLLEQAVAASTPYLPAAESDELSAFARRLRQKERLDPGVSKGRHAAAYQKRHRE